jgi:hypothetical protein
LFIEKKEEKMERKFKEERSAQNSGCSFAQAIS